MSFQNVSPDRLFQILNNTGLQNKDNRLYQLLFWMISAILQLNNDLAGSSSSGGGSSSQTIINQIIQMLGSESGGSGSDDFVIPGPPGSNGRDGQQGAPGFIFDDPAAYAESSLMIPGPMGPAGPMVPYYIGVNETFYVPLYKQALFAMEIQVDGMLEIDGFLIEVDENESLPYLQFSDTTDQTPGATTPTKATFNTQDQVNLFTYSLGDITVERTGLYVFVCCGQITETSNGKVNLDMWFRVNGVDVPNSGVRNSIASTNDNKVLVITYVLPLVINDIFNVYFSVDDATKGAGLHAFAPAGEAAIPSIMLTARKVG